MVGLAGCDKSLPGMMMAMLRLNVPAVFMYGGSILPGKFKGRDVTVVDVFEGVGQHSAGNMSDEELHELECVACPGAGACGGQFTANTMAMRIRGDRAGAAGFGRRARALRKPRRVCAGERQGGDAARRRRHPSARHLHAQGVRECGHHRGGDRRLDQCRPASAGHGARVRHRVRPDRRAPRSSSARPTSPTSSPAANTSPRTCTTSAACRRSCARCSTAATCTRTASRSPARPSSRTSRT